MRHLNLGKFQTLTAVILALLVLFMAPSFFGGKGPHTLTETPVGDACNGTAVFYGYTFLYPEIINKNAAFAPFFTRWDDYYQQYYYSRDIQKEENIAEWIGRFCNQPTKEDVEYVIYKASAGELRLLYNAAADPDRRTPLPYELGDNTFAEMLAYNHCTETISYLMYARSCEPYVTTSVSSWEYNPQDTARMYQIIQEGLGAFKDTDSHFLKMRYAYQMVRMAHYIQDYQYTVELYQYLLPKIDTKKKPSIIYFWTLSHLAGALQKLGNYPEAAYRFSQVFRHCASKRIPAYRSLTIRNDADWKKTLLLCQNDDELCTLYLLRAGGSPAYTISDMREIYNIDSGYPHLDILLVSDVQELEKVFLSTWVTDRKQGKPVGVLKRQAAANHLLDLQQFVGKVKNDKKTPNLNLWKAMEGYLLLLAGDRYGAENAWKRLESSLKNTEPDNAIKRQLEIWRLLLEILNLDTQIADLKDKAANDSLLAANINPAALAFKIRGYAAFRYNPNFEPFLQEWLSSAYAAKNRPGRAILAAYEPSALGLNPNLAAIDDVLRMANEKDPVLLERAMKMDTNPDRVKAYFLEMKGAYLLGKGEPEAALAVMRAIPEKEAIQMTKFSPFKESISEAIHRPITDTLLLNRREIAQKILNFEFRAKAAVATDDPVGGWYYYLIGLAYYNMSYFGHSWEATDYFRSGYNQNRLAQGPVFPMVKSPEGNRENTDVSIALSYFQKAWEYAKTKELGARATFMAARCQQKQWFCSPDSKYNPGSDLIPNLPDEYNKYYNRFLTKYTGTAFYDQVIKECKWMEAYAR